MSIKNWTARTEQIMKQLPVGIEEFSQIIQDGYYYVDKTNIIKENIFLNDR